MENLANDINSLNDLITAIKNIVPNLGWMAYSITLGAAFLPAPNGDSPLAKVHRIINLIACNFGHAANAAKQDGE